MLWWQWMILGAILLGAEMFAIDAQFYLVFIGVSAALVGVAGLFGIVMPLWLQWTVFGLLSLIFMFTFRRQLYEKIRGDVEGFRETLSGETVAVPEELAPGADARLDYRGSRWNVRNVGDTAIAAGTRGRVVKAEGLTLHIEAE